MEIKDLADIGVESCFSLLLIVIAYKIFRAKIITESDGNCLKCFHFKWSTHNPGVDCHENINSVI